MTHPQILLIFGSFLGGGRGYRDFLFETARMGVYLYHSDDPHPNFVHFYFGGLVEGTGTSNQRLRGKLQQFGTKGYQGERNRCDSKDIL